MRFASRLTPAALLFPAAVAAQASPPAPVGTVVVGVHVTPRQTASTAMFGGAVLKLTAGSDGQRTSVTIAFDSVSGSGAFLNGAWLRSLTRQGDDSIDLLAALPATLRAMLPPTIIGDSTSQGLRLRLSTRSTDSIVQNDSLVKDSSRATPTGVMRTVAGTRCEDWNVISGSDTAVVCMAAQTAAMAPLIRWATAKLHLDGPRGQRLAGVFGGRKLIPLRAVSGDSSAVVEVLSASADAPPAGAFEIPAGFHLLDADALKGMVPPGLMTKKP